MAPIPRLRNRNCSRKKEDDFSPVRRLPCRASQPTHAIGHRLLLELGEIDERTLRHRITKDTGRSGASRGWCGHLGGVDGHLWTFPGGTQAFIPSVAGGEPKPPRCQDRQGRSRSVPRFQVST